MNKSLSIIIVSFNSKDYLDKCIISIEKSKLNIKFEIIVIDNASQDSTIDYNRKRHPNVRFFRNNINTGFSYANNQGIKMARGNYILLLNPDTIIPSNTISVMLDFMDNNKETGVSTCRVELLDGTIDDACHRGFPTPWNAFCHFGGLSSLFPYSLFFNGYHLGFRHLDKIHEIDCCTGAFMLIRRDAGAKVDWLDEDYFWYGEDIDFCFKVKKAGYKIYYIPGVKIIHYKGVSSGIKKHSESMSTASFETKYSATKARFSVMKIFYRKHYKNDKGRILMPLIFFAINIKEWITLTRLKINHRYENRI